MTTATPAAPNATPSTDNVPAYGWEVHCTAGTSDKFYRVVVVQPFVVAIYGRRDSVGQVTVYRCASDRAAVNKATELTDAKEAKGYHLTRDFTTLEATPGVLADLAQISGSDRSRRAGQSLSRWLVDTSRRTGTTLPGASS